MTRRKLLRTTTANTDAPNPPLADAPDDADAHRRANEQWYETIRRELSDDDLRAAEVPPVVEDPAGLEDIWQRALIVADPPPPAVAVGDWIARLLLLRDDLPPQSKLRRAEVCVEFGEIAITIDL